MKSQQQKVPEPILKNWWWRRIVFLNYDESTHTTGRRIFVPELPSYGFNAEWNMWHGKEELAAFRFELIRRVAFDHLPEWHRLPTWLVGWVAGVLEPKNQRAVCALFSHPPEGYASLDWMWDLKASDESLCRAFIGHINQERKKMGLPITNDPFASMLGKSQKHGEKRRGMRNRQVSWLAVEAYDIQRHKLYPLSDGERSRLSKARREIGVFEEPLKVAIGMAERNTPLQKREAFGESLYTRFIRENFIEHLASRLQRQ